MLAPAVVCKKGFSISTLANNTLAKLRAGQLTGAKRLDLSCGLTAFPTEIYDLAESLEVLNLTGNALSSLPDDLTKLSKLKVIFCSQNQFTHVPEVLGQCSGLTMVGFKSNKINVLPVTSLPENLQWLILTDNQLKSIPAQLGQCSRLQKLMLAGNLLTMLPSEMAACEQLALLRISANRLTELPEWLLSLPRLAWLAYAGNPFCHALETSMMASQQVAMIDWATLQLQHPLGEGASGVIYQANWQNLPEKNKTVALKLFKGTVTSDGLPLNEMAACVAAGEHSHLPEVQGMLSHHPEGLHGLVMHLIKPSYQNLAQPPTLSTCTRDVYARNVRFSLAQLIRIALSIASVMQHLHAKGMMHGDLYAHNILHNGAGDCLLSDFGAASFLPTESRTVSTALQHIEMQAYAYLLEELITRCEEQESATLAHLRKIQQACGHLNATARPLFAEVTEMLASMSKE